MFSVDALVQERLPKLSSKHPLINKTLSKSLKYLSRESECDALFKQSLELERSFVQTNYGAEQFAQSDSYSDKLMLLKSSMQAMGESIPTLYKQYTELTGAGGTRFLAFNIDQDFADCIDGFMVVDVNKIKSSKRKRYIGE